MIIIAPVATFVANAIIATVLGITVGHFAVKASDKIKRALKKNESDALKTPTKRTRAKKVKS